MTRRPGRLKAQIKMPFPRPRTYGLIGQAEFAALRAKIVDMLREEWTGTTSIASGASAA